MSGTIHKTAELSAAFVAVMREWLTPAQCAEVDRRNGTPQYLGCCATHDYCDANMAMMEAFETVFGREPDCDSDADVGAINAAWDAAKRAGFAG